MYDWLVATGKGTLFLLMIRCHNEDVCDVGVTCGHRYISFLTQCVVVLYTMVRKIEVWRKPNLGVSISFLFNRGAQQHWCSHHKATAPNLKCTNALIKWKVGYTLIITVINTVDLSKVIVFICSFTRADRIRPFPGVKCICSVQIISKWYINWLIVVI